MCLVVACQLPLKVQEVPFGVFSQLLLSPAVLVSVMGCNMQLTHPQV